MSPVDIRELTKESLSEGSFPVDPKADFRFYMTEAVHKTIQDHAKADVSVEICGVLVGRWEKDRHGPFAKVSECIRCQQATSKFAEVTFTHESWAQINQEMDSKYADLRIIGWYHSHPDFGIFLSDRDVFIHENFFSGPGQVAYVVDPVRDLEGVFIWQAGKPVPTAHYWIGNRVRTVDATVRSTAHLMGTRPADHNEPAHNAPPASRPDGTLPLAATLLTWVAVFLMGYLLAGQRSRWEQKMVEQGAVVHYGLNKVMKFGFEEDMKTLQKVLAGIHAEFQSLPEVTADLTEEQIEERAQKRKLIASSIGQTVGIVEQLRVHYALSETEQHAILALIAQKEAELQGAKSKAEQTMDSKTENGTSNSESKTTVSPGTGSPPKHKTASPSEKPNPPTSLPAGTVKEAPVESGVKPVAPTPAQAEKPSS